MKKRKETHDPLRYILFSTPLATNSVLFAGIIQPHPQPPHAPDSDK